MTRAGHAKEAKMAHDNYEARTQSVRRFLFGILAAIALAAPVSDALGYGGTPGSPIGRTNRDNGGAAGFGCAGCHNATSPTVDLTSMTASATGCPAPGR
jgi:hypothetical protein